MSPTKPWVLVAVAAVCAVVAWLVVRGIYTSLPPLPWTAAIAMLLLGVAEAASGRNLRTRIRGGPGFKPVNPLAAVRMAALGKASSHAAAAIGGLTLGFLVYLLGSLDKPVPRSDAVTAAGTLVAAVVLLLGALYLEYSLRLPPDQDEEQDEETGRRQTRR
jgi:hypothetical protein